MKRYKNLSGISGIRAYETGADHIIVAFTNDGSYLYNYQVTGKEAVEHMKKLAERGLGLSTYISQHVKDRYARKLS